MIRIRGIIIGTLLMLNIGAKAVVNDTATTGAGNALMTFYQLSTGQKTTAANNDWHLAVSVRPSLFPNNTLQGTTLRINEAFGVKAFEMPDFTADSFSVVIDTVGFHIWQRLFDSDSVMDAGALNTGRNISVFNYGWGVYTGPPLHNVVGNKVYLLQLPNRSFKKILIQQLDRDTAWDIALANVDNSDFQQIHISKKAYQGKNFVYLNLLNDNVLDKEPFSPDWDLQFLQYAATDVSPSVTVPSVGVWTNKGRTVAKRSGVAISNDSYSGLTFSSNMNAIGWNWKYLINNEQYLAGKNSDVRDNYYDVKDSLVYFIQTLSGDVYKLNFTAYEGMETGIIRFQTALVAPNKIEDLGKDEGWKLYPNPASTVLRVSSSQYPALFQVYDLSGRKMAELNLFEAGSVDVSVLPRGVYVATLTVSEQTITKKLVIE